jgi:hypothetical protein
MISIRPLEIGLHIKQICFLLGLPSMMKISKFTNPSNDISPELFFKKVNGNFLFLQGKEHIFFYYLHFAPLQMFNLLMKSYPSPNYSCNVTHWISLIEVEFFLYCYPVLCYINQWQQYLTGNREIDFFSSLFDLLCFSTFSHLSFATYSAAFLWAYSFWRVHVNMFLWETLKSVYIYKLY